MRGISAINNRTVLIILLLGMSWPLQGQTLNDLAESALYKDETSELPNPVFERMEMLKQDPMDLNGATRDELYESGLFTAFQVEVLLNYREQYGPLFSIYELAGLSCFRRSRLAEISPCITAGSRTVPSSGKKKTGWMLLEGSTSRPVAESYLTGDSLHARSRYPGNPYRFKGRVRVEPTRYLSMGAAFEKDPGERFFTQNRPELLTGYLAFQGSRRMKNLIAGTFRIHHGLGLVNGTGLIHTIGSYSLQPLSVPNLSPSASLAESRYEQGLACQLIAGESRYLIWSSYVPMDLSLQQFSPDRAPVDWEERERTSGLHRTATEILGSALAFRSHHGTLLSWRKERLRIEAMAGVRINGLTGAGRDSLRLDPGLSLFPLGSLYSGWSGDRLQLAAEIASTPSGAFAFQAVAGVRFSNFISGLFLLHHYGSGYRGMFPSSYGAGSKMSNDQGVGWAWHLEAERIVVADLSIELFRFPDPVQRAPVPSHSYRIGAKFRNAGYGSLSWMVRAWKKGWQYTDKTDAAGPSPLKWAEVTRLDIQCRQSTGDQFQWVSRLIISWYSRSLDGNPGYASAQQFTWAPTDFFRTSVQLVHYRVGDWDNRIYLHEPGLYYHFQFPVCYGNGEKFAAVFTLKAGSRIALSWKIATQYKNAGGSSDSSDTEVLWQRKWDLALQVRLQL